MSENGEIYTAGNKFYTPAGTDGMDKFHLCRVDTIWYSWVPEKNHLKTAGEPVQYLGRMQRILFGTAGYSWVLESRYCA